jgi:hypothetical protein
MYNVYRDATPYTIHTDLNTGAFNGKYGGAEPGSGSLNASRIMYLDYSDDPWNRASVNKQVGAI